ncbi:MAG: hypothetical protein ACLUR5_06670 [Eubacterium ventriosum]
MLPLLIKEHGTNMAKELAQSFDQNQMGTGEPVPDVNLSEDSEHPFNERGKRER